MAWEDDRGRGPESGRTQELIRAPVRREQRFDLAMECVVALRPLAEIRGAFVGRAFERAVEQLTKRFPV